MLCFLEISVSSFQVLQLWEVLVPAKTKKQFFSFGDDPKKKRSHDARCIHMQISPIFRPLEFWKASTNLRPRRPRWSAPSLSLLRIAQKWIESACEWGSANSSALVNVLYLAQQNRTLAHPPRKCTIELRVLSSDRNRIVSDRRRDGRDVKASSTKEEGDGTGENGREHQWLRLLLRWQRQLRDIRGSKMA